MNIHTIFLYNIKHNIYYYTIYYIKTYKKSNLTFYNNIIFVYTYFIHLLIIIHFSIIIQFIISKKRADKLLFVKLNLNLNLNINN